MKKITEKQRLLETAKQYIEQSELTQTEKDILTENVFIFLSIISKDSIIRDCQWRWFKEKDGIRGLDLVWDWDYFEGTFSFYTNNGYSFDYSIGNGVGEWCGGDDGKDGFYPDYDVDELQLLLIGNGLA